MQDVSVQCQEVGSWIFRSGFGLLKSDAEKLAIFQENKPSGSRFRKYILC